MGNIFEKINDLLWGEAVIAVIFAAWIYLSVKAGFPQLHPIEMIKAAFGGKNSGNGKGISRSRAVCTALAASMGTGNIAGAAAAIASGGPGAIVWMLLAAFFGMSAAYAENWLGAVHGTKHGIPPPISYIREMPAGRVMSEIYPWVCILSGYLMGNMVQGNALCTSAAHISGGNIFIVSLICAAVIGAVIAGGRNRIASAAERIIPIASAVYILSAVGALIVYREKLPMALNEIMRSAFGVRAAGGGLVGYTMKQAVSTGMRRGIFSNEAGLGSSVLVHSTAERTDPHEVGCWAALEVFIDTVICCTLTGLVITVSGADAAGGEITALEEAFSVLPWGCGRYVIPISMILFASASVIGWCCCGEICLRSAVKGSRWVYIYRGLHILMMFFGGISDMSVLWGAADTVNWIMLAINLPAVILLFPEEYGRRRKKT